MEYHFKCNKCNTDVYRNIPMSEYDEQKDKQKCNNCGSKLERVIEFEGAVGKTGGYDAVAGKASWQ